MPANRDSHTWGFMARNRMRLTYWALLALLVLAWLAGARPATLLWPAGWAWAAILLLLAGTGLRSWAAGILRKDRQLATRGPYAWSRHPLYIANALLLLGWAAQWAAGGAVPWLVPATAVLAALLYLPTLRDEEAAARTHFGAAYDDYCRQTGRVAPKRWPPAWAADWSLAQWRYNREYQLVVIVLLVQALFEGLARLG